MQARVTIVRGKRRITLIREATGIDKTREAVLAVMGPNFQYKDTPKESK